MTAVTRPDWSGRLARLQAGLADAALEAQVISAPRNIRYLTGFDGTAGLLVIAPRAAVLLVDGRYSALARERQAQGVLAPDVEAVEVSGPYDTALVALLGARGWRRVGFESQHVTVAGLARWERAAPDVYWGPVEDAVERLRLVKDAFEVAVFRRAGEQLAGVARALGSLVAAGRTEREVARAIDAALERAGFQAVAFPTIVASGPHSALPHARPTERRLGPGDLVVLDFGGVLDGYCVDLTRMAAVGEPSPPLRAAFEAVREAQAAALAAVRPGIEASAVDTAARDRLAAHGLGEAFLHATGHGLGLEVHEAPRLGRATDHGSERLAEGMVFTVEPGAYLEGLGGARLEDDVLVLADGCAVLTDAPRDLLIV
ncbi:MAG: Xaa-Pro peptidase family protein [Vicinamibacterales bacterium]